MSHIDIVKTCQGGREGEGGGRGGREELHTGELVRVVCLFFFNLCVFFREC